MNIDSYENSTLVMALPSKGRLQEQSFQLLEKAGLKISGTRVDREYSAVLQGLPGVRLTFMQMSEMPRYLADGKIHLCMTGEDMIREKIPDHEQRTALLLPLGFGYARLIVAVPACWTDVRNMMDLDDVAADFRRIHLRPLRIATKYLRLTRHFFAIKGLSCYRLLESHGATEGMPANGSADAIVDITSSGETLRANHLRVLDDGLILESQAMFCASLRARWGKAEIRVLQILLNQIEAARAAHEHVVIRAEFPDSLPADFCDALQRTTGVLLKEKTESLSKCRIFYCQKNQLVTAVDFLLQSGIGKIDVAAPDMLFRSGSSVYDRFCDLLRKEK